MAVRPWVRCCGNILSARLLRAWAFRRHAVCRWLQRAKWCIGVDANRVRAVIDAVLARGEQKLSELDALAVIEAYGIPTVGARVARTAEDAAAYADALGGGPVVLKIVSPEVIHKTDVGGVRLGLTGADAVQDAFREIVASVRRAVPDARIDGVLVQRQLSAGRELIAGISRQPDFGALVMVGLGGVLVEVLRDVSFRLAPIDAQEADDMLAGLRGARLLGALRGMPAADRTQLADVLVRVARLGADFPQIEELDINPLLISGKDGVAVDARVLLGRGRESTSLDAGRSPNDHKPPAIPDSHA